MLPTSIMQILKNGLAILAYFFNPEVRKKRDRKKDWNRMKELEKKYRQALANRDPVTASLLHQEMVALRAEYKYINKK